MCNVFCVTLIINARIKGVSPQLRPSAATGKIIYRLALTNLAPSHIAFNFCLVAQRAV